MVAYNVKQVLFLGIGAQSVECPTLEVEVLDSQTPPLL